MKSFLVELLYWINALVKLIIHCIFSIWFFLSLAIATPIPTNCIRRIFNWKKFVDDSVFIKLTLLMLTWLQMIFSHIFCHLIWFRFCILAHDLDCIKWKNVPLQWRNNKIILKKSKREAERVRERSKQCEGGGRGNEREMTTVCAQQSQKPSYYCDNNNMVYHEYKTI